jgi:solute carrier family 35 protein F1/2
MLLEDATIPCVFLLSIFFLKIVYSKTHYFAILLCFCGLCCSISNDVFVKIQDTDQSDSPLPFSKVITGDVMTLVGACFYGISNILQEHFLKTKQDVNHYLGFLGLFGCGITIIEAYFFNEYIIISSFLSSATLSDKWYLIWNLGCFMLVNFMIYSIIPLFIQRSGATLLNISNVTTVIWGMFSDILFFGKSFYILYCVAFCFEMTGVILFSIKRPTKKQDNLTDERNEQI